MIKADLFENLRAMGLLNYNEVVDGDILREMAGIHYPEVGTKADFDAPALEELAVVDYIRNRLLGEGKYLKAIGRNYRILSPSENAGQIDSYMRSADKKLRRAIQLSKNTPATQAHKCQNTARIMMKQESISKKRNSILTSRGSNERPTQNHQSDHT